MTTLNRFFTILALAAFAFSAVGVWSPGLSEVFVGLIFTGLAFIVSIHIFVINHETD